jgi:hypothetical protein
MSTSLCNDDIKHIQRVVFGSIFYYACAVDLMVLMALSIFASKQRKGMDNTMLKTKQLLDYLATRPNVMVRFHASNMILNMSDRRSESLSLNID